MRQTQSVADAQVSGGNMNKVPKILALVWATVALAAVGCDRNDTPAERAVDGAQDALDMREHEKLKDAGEDAADAVENAAEGIRDETGVR